MEVMVGSSFGIGLSAYVRERDGVSAQDKALFLADEPKRGGGSQRIGLNMSCESPEESSEDSSSSIGECNDEEDDDVSDQGGFDSFSSSLEDSLPNKRGLSNHYVGKSKSFGNLMEAKNFDAKDLEKTENPLNKKRRLIIANKMKLRGGKRSFSASNFYTWQNPNSLPLLALQESNRDSEKEEEGDGDDNDDQTTMMMKNKRDLIVQTHSCFCLSSLQEEEDDDDDDDDE